MDTEFHVAETLSPGGATMKDDDSYELRMGPQISSDSRIVERRRNGKTELCSLSTMEDGKPLPPGAEVVDVTFSPSDEGWHKTKTVFRNGPAQVATPAYCAGYDRIFGKRKVGVA